MFRIIGIAYEKGESRKILYADDFSNYTEAYDYAGYLDDPHNWKSNNLPKQPTIIYIEEY